MDDRDSPASGDQSRARARLWAGVSALLVLSAWGKLAAFHLPPPARLATDWFWWSRDEALLALAGSLGSVLLLSAPLLLLRLRARVVALWLFNLLIATMVLADLLHFSYFEDIISLSSLSAAWQVAPVYRSVLALLRLRHALLFVDLPLVLLLWWRYPPGAAVRSRIRPAIVAGVAVAGALLLLIPVHLVRENRGLVFSTDFFRFHAARRIGLLNVHALELGRLLARRADRTAISAEEREAVRQFIASRRSPESPSPLFGAARGSNVIFVMVEALTAFPLDLRVGGEEVTPNLNRVARESLRFTSFYGQTWLGESADGEFLALQSLHPPFEGSVPALYPTNRFRALPSILGERGYATLSAHGYYGALYRMREMHPRYGFARSLFLDSYRITEYVGMGVSDADFLAQTAPRLRELDEPFMALLITLSTHHAYPLPTHHKRLRLGALEGTQVGDYLHVVHYFDHAFGDFLRDLERAGLLDRTTIVVFGDHRARFDDPTVLLRAVTDAPAGVPADTVDARLWQLVNRLPLLVRLPLGAHAGTIAGSGGQIDVAPTVLSLLGVPVDDWPGIGHDLTRGRPALVVLRSGSFVMGDTLCLVSPSSRTVHRCRTVPTGAPVDSIRMARHARDAREELRVSSLILRGDLLPTMQGHPR